MNKMKPLIITATPNICWLHPEIKYPLTTEEVVEEAVKCREAGASILHIHSEGKIIPVADGVRAKTDLLLQGGMSSIDLEGRRDMFLSRYDMISVTITHHSEAFAEVNIDMLHPLKEVEEYCEECKKFNMKPELEVWGTGALYVIERLEEKNLLEAPYIITQFFGWPGGAWTPPTVEEYYYRRRLEPANAVCFNSIMHKDQLKILVNAIINGDNVRVGTEDWPYDVNGKPCATHELVAQIAAISRSLGREVATPEQAREILGLQKK